MVTRRYIIAVLVLVGLFEASFELRSQTDKFKGPRNLGKIDYHIINEASGIAASRKNRNVLWVHNDDSSEVKVYAINSSAKIVAIYVLNIKQGRDWEDIAIGPGPEANSDYIYLGDIGDNFRQYEFKYIYRFKEPKVSEGQKLIVDTIRVFDKIAFKLPTEMVYDMEALMLDPLTKDLYVISKRLQNEKVFRIAYPQNVEKVNIAELICQLPYGYEGFKGSGVTGGDISADGQEILIRTYAKVYYYKRNRDESIKDALGKKPKRVRYEMEPQGEGICWHPELKGFYTISEFSQFEVPPHLYFYEREKDKGKKKNK